MQNCTVDANSMSQKAFFSHLAMVFFVWVITWLPLSGRAQGFLKADGQRIVDGSGRNVLLRGIGLGGWMLQEGYMLRISRDGQQHKIRERVVDLIGEKQADEFYEAWLRNHTQKADIDSLKAWGFNSVRLPMHYNLYTLPIEAEPEAGKDTWLERGFALTDSLLAWCKTNSMYLILDLHAAPGGQGNDLNISDRDPSKPSLWESPQNQRKMIALWRKLAERYANESWVGGYDIINEPNWGFTDLSGDRNGTKEQKNEPLKKLMMAITSAIRSVDENHLIIIEGNGWGNNYNGVLPPWDKNMALSFHKYWNYNDPASIKGILELRQKYNIPVWLGETGENSNVWFTEAIRLLESNNIGWSWWPLKKLGNNNPFEIKSNLNYDRIVRYWNGQGPRPSESDAYSGLMELVSSLKCQNNIVHQDVVDAMIRQPFSNEARPFKLYDIGDSQLIKAVDYDLGKNGVAYYDKDTADYHVSTGKGGRGNRGHVYRNDGVDIFPDSTAYDSYYVGSTEDGEWLQYTVHVKKAGIYGLGLHVVSESANSMMSVAVNGMPVQRGIVIPLRKSSDKWNLLQLKNIRLLSGRNIIRIAVEKGGFNFKDFWIRRAAVAGKK